MTKLPTKKLHPFKIVCLLLYGSHSTVTWEGGGYLEMKLGPWAKMLGVPNDKLRVYLEDLQRMRYIAGLTFSYGRANFRLLPPPQDRLFGEKTA